MAHIRATGVFHIPVYNTPQSVCNEHADHNLSPKPSALQVLNYKPSKVRMILRLSDTRQLSNIPQPFNLTKLYLQWSQIIFLDDQYTEIWIEDMIWGCGDSGCFVKTHYGRIKRNHQHSALMLDIFWIYDLSIISQNVLRTLNVLNLINCPPYGLSIQRLINRNTKC